MVFVALELVGDVIREDMLPSSGIHHQEVEGEDALYSGMFSECIERSVQDSPGVIRVHIEIYGCRHIRIDVRPDIVRPDHSAYQGTDIADVLSSLYVPYRYLVCFHHGLRSSVYHVLPVSFRLDRHLNVLFGRYQQVVRLVDYLLVFHSVVLGGVQGSPFGQECLHLPLDEV